MDHWSHGVGQCVRSRASRCAILALPFVTRVGCPLPSKFEILELKGHFEIRGTRRQRPPEALLGRPDATCHGAAIDVEEGSCGGRIAICGEVGAQRLPQRIAIATGGKWLEV